MSLEQLPPLDKTALLLDVDGTLLDFAATPLEVSVPAGLPEILATVKRRLGGALGMISGRPVEQVDALFGDIPEAIAGEHGGAVPALAARAGRTATTALTVCDVADRGRGTGADISGHVAGTQGARFRAALPAGTGSRGGAAGCDQQVDRSRSGLRSHAGAHGVGGAATRGG